MIVLHYFCEYLKAIMLQFFGTFILFSYINVCIELCGKSRLRATVYKFTLVWI